MILLISDLYKSLDSMEEMNSVKWLLDVLDELKPEYLIGAGDWGEAMTAEDFSEILTRARLYPNMRDSESAMLMTQALERIRPRLHFNGHMTGGCYSYYEFKWGKYLRVDSSARFRCYALTDGRDVAVYQKGEEVFRFSL